MVSCWLARGVAWGIDKGVVCGVAREVAWRVGWVVAWGKEGMACEVPWWEAQEVARG